MRYDFPIRVYEMRQGPKGEAVPMRGPSPEDLASLDRFEATHKILRVGPASYEVTPKVRP